MGYSVGRWEGDTLVVESIGFNERTWLDFHGHPHTEALHITERFQRRNVGVIDLQVTLDDKAAYSRPWTVPVTMTLAADTDLLEFVCNENESRRTSLSGRTPEQQRISLPSSTLDEYAGTYAITSTERMPFQTLRIRHISEDLFLDADGKGNILILPLSATEFSARLFSLGFKRNAEGVVTGAVILENGAVLTKQR